MIDNRRSKRLSYWLRHAPEAGGLQLDTGGWAAIESVLDSLQAAGLRTSTKELKGLVAENDKQRFEVSADDSRIRARQGHSIRVEGDWPSSSPPPLLYHGTTAKLLSSIMQQGLLPRARHHVHLSSTTESAEAVGARRGRAVVLSVAAARMVADGHIFRLARNGVWLSDHVPAVYLELLQQSR